MFFYEICFNRIDHSAIHIHTNAYINLEINLFFTNFSMQKLNIHIWYDDDRKLTIFCWSKHNPRLPHIDCVSYSDILFLGILFDTIVFESILLWNNCLSDKSIFFRTQFWILLNEWRNRPIHFTWIISSIIHLHNINLLYITHHHCNE